MLKIRFFFLVWLKWKRKWIQRKLKVMLTLNPFYIRLSSGCNLFLIVGTTSRCDISADSLTDKEMRPFFFLDLASVLARFFSLVYNFWNVLFTVHVTLCAGLFEFTVYLWLFCLFCLFFFFVHLFLSFFRYRNVY